MPPRGHAVQANSHDLFTYAGCFILAVISSYVRQMSVDEARRWTAANNWLPAVQSGLTSLAMALWMVATSQVARPVVGAIAIVLGLSGAESINIVKNIILKNMREYIDKQEKAEAAPPPPAAPPAAPAPAAPAPPGGGDGHG